MFRNFIAFIAAVFALNAFAAVDVNQASRAELESIKGIGPGLSGKITEARQAGHFKTGLTWCSASAASGRATRHAFQRPG